MHVLVLLDPDHERSGARSHRMVFAQDGPIRVGSGGQLVQGNAGVGGGDGALVGFAGAFHDERVDVHMADVPVHRYAGGYPFARDDQRHLGRFLVHRRLAPQAPGAEIVAVIAGVQHSGRIVEAHGFKRRQDLANLLVQERAQSPVARQGPAHPVFAVEVGVVVVGAGVVEEERVVRPLLPRILFRPRQIVAVVVPIEVLGRRGQWKVRGHERHEEHPGLVAMLRRFLVQPDLRFGRDVPVVARVDGLAGSGHAGHLPGALAHRKVVADQAHEVALALDDVHGDPLHVEAVVVAGGAEMELADGLHSMAALPEMVVPGWCRALVGIGVVPVADLVGVLAGREGGAGRYADRVAAVRAREARTACGEPVEVGRVRQRTAVAAEHLGAVLVGHDHDQIPGFHVLRSRLLTPARRREPPAL